MHVSLSLRVAKSHRLLCELYVLLKPFSSSLPILVSCLLRPHASVPCGCPLHLSCTYPMRVCVCVRLRVQTALFVKLPQLSVRNPF